MPRRNKNASKSLRRSPAAERSNLRRRATPPKKKPEDIFEEALQADGYAGYVKQHRFHPKRRWQFDFAWPEVKLAVEIEGGIFIRGRHVSPSGFVKDCEKYNTASTMGWTVLRIPVAGKTWVEDAIDLIGRWYTERT